MMRIAAKADANRPKSQGVRFEIKPWQKNVTILWERATPAPPGEGIENPETGSGPPIIRSGEIEPVKMTDYGIFAATEKSDMPYAFVIDGRDWAPDPSAPLAPVATFGRRNSLLVVGEDQVL